jgi:hypothetical protein
VFTCSLEYVSHKFLPLEKEIAVLRASLELERQKRKDADLHADQEIARAKEFRAEKAAVEVTK